MAVEDYSFSLASNTACANARGERQGLYLVTAHLLGRNGGLLGPESFDAGFTLPDDQSPLGMVNWVFPHLRDKRKFEKSIPVEADQIAALAISRLCFNRRHVSESDTPDTKYASARLERVRSMLFQAKGAELIPVDASKPFKTNNRGTATLKRADPGQPELSDTIMLPFHSTHQVPHRVLHAVELPKLRHFTSTVYGGVNDLIERVDYEAMWAGEPQPDFGVPPVPDRPKSPMPEQRRLVTPQGYARQTPPPRPPADDPPPF